jgi:GNAT superfamily N-acetyltransferase
MMTFQQEFIVNIKDECSSLIEAHWEEIALNKDIIKLSPDWQAYKNLEDSGVLRIFTVRSDSVLVGYFVLFVRTHIHYSEHLFAVNDVIYLHPDFRRGSVASKLIKFAESCLKEDGVKVMVVNSKVHAPFDPLLKRLKFDHVENTFMKRL